MVWILLFLAAGFGIVYVVDRLIDGADSYEFVRRPILEAMLALSFGDSLIWRQRVNSNGAAQSALAADSP